MKDNKNSKRIKLLRQFGYETKITDKYDQLKNFITLVSEGSKNSLIVSGEAGLSKTTTVYESIKELGIPYAWANVHIGCINDLYKVLYKENGKVLIFDDTDYLIHKTRGKKFREMLLSATELSNNRLLQIKDTRDKEVKSKNNPKGEYPQSFIFTGRIIFITNLEQKYIDSSLVSRSLKVDIRFTKFEIIKLIEDGLHQYYSNISVNIKLEVINFIKNIVNDIDKLDFRHYYDILILRLRNDPNWKKWSINLFFNN
jgi:hypothetical protein